MSTKTQPTKCLSQPNNEQRLSPTTTCHVHLAGGGSPESANGHASACKARSGRQAARLVPCSFFCPVLSCVLLRARKTNLSILSSKGKCTMLFLSVVNHLSVCFSIKQEFYCRRQNNMQKRRRDGREYSMFRERAASKRNQKGESSIMVREGKRESTQRQEGRHAAW